MQENRTVQTYRSIAVQLNMQDDCKHLFKLSRETDSSQQWKTLSTFLNCFLTWSLVFMGFFSVCKILFVHSEARLQGFGFIHERAGLFFQAAYRYSLFGRAALCLRHM